MTANPNDYPESPAVNALVVTPSDTLDLPGGACRKLVIGVAGNVSVIMVNGVAPVVIGLTAGIHGLRVTRVLATSTTATGIVALY